MPIGVPKVPFRCPGEEDASWVDIYNRLYRQRFLFLAQVVDSEISNQLIGLMVYLAIEDPTKDQYLFIHSPGGWILPGLGLYDAMQFVPPDVHTVGMGLVASMGSFILAGGEITKRMAFPHARVMMHQPASLFCDTQAGDVTLEAGELMSLRETLTRVYAQRTGKPLWVVSKDIERDIFMSAKEAKAYGIVDLIAGDDLVAGE
uniref:ATP-dependent Clp protease proteolytic subunit n=4 Tax=Vincetoxicum TaxID=63501 RepID=A0A977LKW0_9GENT|nr:clp protease proteolytic subunit protein [Vincetoxicum insigne]YP_010247995.1 ATP-dependent Clp protease proteolytic subunit [Vincetoxicum forrestii]YP_010451783.1 clp protease proteolytic subunit [Vincetoxicum mongolicum]YP_010507494.1 clp protease proteolytic subunit [Vincetoxicum pingtaoanum]YP_010608134.1 clp protease proteolytic subunit [Vincetoxicum lindleyi]AGW05031.1 clp protease proteolytic subunit protein [Vincetoxicum rossicum]QCF45842.1 clp protease proteolytic subunit protein 